MAAKKRGEIGNPFATFGSPDNGTPVEQQASTPASQQASTPVEQQASTPVGQQASTPVGQFNSMQVKQYTSKPALKKYTYYLTDALDMKLEQIRLARRTRGVNIDKSALVREAIDLLQESDAQPVAQPAPIEQKSPPHVEVEAPPLPGDTVSLQEFADLHAVNRNEAARLCGQGAITGIRQGAGRHTVIFLDAKGRRDFWVQFHETQGFRACDDCPHTRV